MTADRVVARYGLRPHPEGGYFREVHRSSRALGVPAGYPGERVAATAIYFLLPAGQFSAFHRVRSEELWIHVAGAPLELVLLDDAPSVLEVSGSLEAASPLAVVPPGVLQAARSRGDWSLVVCVVAPGFDFGDFELPSREELRRRYPEWEELIGRFTREP